MDVTIEFNDGTTDTFTQAEIYHPKYKSTAFRTEIEYIRAIQKAGLTQWDGTNYVLFVPEGIKSISFPKQ